MLQLTDWILVQNVQIVSVLIKRNKLGSCTVFSRSCILLFENFACINVCVWLSIWHLAFGLGSGIFWDMKPQESLGLLFKLKGSNWTAAIGKARKPSPRNKERTTRYTCIVFHCCVSIININILNCFNILHAGKILPFILHWDWEPVTLRHICVVLYIVVLHCWLNVFLVFF